MTNEQYESIKALRKAGFAVAVFSPSELRGVEPAKVEAQLVEYGWDVIDALDTWELQR